MTRTAWLFILLASCAAPPASIDWTSATWVPLTTGTKASLRGVCVLDGVVWASGSGGTVLRSTDAGDTFSVHIVPGAGANDLRDIEAVDATTAYVISITKPARILRTTNGGADWDELYVSKDERSFFDSIALFAGGGGVVFGDPRDGVFEILWSADGVRWQHADASSIPPARKGEAAFAASCTCVVTRGARHAWIGTGGMHSRVLGSEDGGRTWRATATPMPSGTQTTGTYGLRFKDRHTGILVGGDYTKPNVGGNNLARTDDGGKTWHLAKPGPGGYRSCVAWLPGAPSTVLAVGRTGADLSSDNGKTWTAFTDPAGFFALHAAADGTVIAVGSNGRAARLAR